MNLVLLGAPGSGKGTQAVSLVQKYGAAHISTGNIFREEIAKKSDLGLKVQDYLTSGRLVPDELTVAVVTRRLEQPDCLRGFLMDGFPRTVAQAEALDAFLSSRQRTLDAVVSMDLSDAELVKRLSNRRQCPACGKIYNLLTQPPREAGKCDVDGGALIQREDDTPETIRRRLQVFQDLTQPLIAYYRGAGLLKPVSAEGTPAEVAQSIGAALNGRK